MGHQDLPPTIPINPELLIPHGQPLEPITEDECTGGQRQCPPPVDQRPPDEGDYWIFCIREGCTLVELDQEEDPDTSSWTAGLAGVVASPFLATGMPPPSDFTGTYSGGMTALHGVDSRTAVGDVDLSVTLPVATGDYLIDLEFLNIRSGGTDVTGEFGSWSNVTMDQKASSFDTGDLTGQFAGDDVSGDFQTNQWGGSYSATKRGP